MKLTPDQGTMENSEESKENEVASVSRREVLKKVGWIVPALTVLPLNQAFAAGRGHTFVSPGPDGPTTPGGYPSRSSSGSRGSGSSGSGSPSRISMSGSPSRGYDKQDFFKKLLSWLFGRR